MKATRVEFEGQEIFITCGERMVYVYPARPGTYWADIESAPGCSNIETGVFIIDDFGNMVNGFHGARQRAHFHHVLH